MKSNMIQRPAWQKPVLQEIIREQKNRVSTIGGLQLIVPSIKSLVTEPPSGLWTCSFFNSLIVYTSGHLRHPSHAF